MKKDHTLTAVLSCSYVGGLMYAWLAYPNVNQGGLYWDALWQYAVGYGWTFIKIAFICFIAGSGTLLFEHMLVPEYFENPPPYKINKWVFRLILASIVFVVMPFVMVSCRRGFS